MVLRASGGTAGSIPVRFRHSTRAIVRTVLAGSHDGQDVTVIIATSQARTHMFAARALASVDAQVGVAPSAVRVVVVDDNADPRELDRVRRAVNDVRASHRLRADMFATTVVRNQRTRAHSGTGAWNTGIELAAASGNGPVWIAILDDDDQFLPEHLGRCLVSAAPDHIAVLEQLAWVRAHGIEPRPFSVDDLTPEAFFVGNPGVQGSNLFVRLTALREIQGFDEELHSATDRDLMIRLLRHATATGQHVHALPSIGVHYFDHLGPRINTDRGRKHAGLDRFYSKHARAFSRELLEHSLERAHRLFGYEANG